MNHEKLSLAEVFGLTPVRTRIAETLLVVKGNPYTPPSRFDLSTLSILKPKLGVQTWLGITREDRRIPIYNLFNHTQTPPEDGWSVRRTQLCDYRGRTCTYDSHNGTDFTIPPGTVVVAPAPGVVLRVSNEFHRGGLKIFIDHGHGVMTTSNHLGRALVRPGEFVERAQPIALSGYSGIDAVVGFPWSAPHVHFNTWLNGEYVDPFAREGEVPLWRTGNEPTPHQDGEQHEDDFQATEWNHEAVQRAIENCLDPVLRKELEEKTEKAQQATDVLFYMNYFPTRFSERPNLYPESFSRQPLLDMPFRASDFVGIVHLDEGF